MGFDTSLILSLIISLEILVVKVLQKQISLIRFRAYLEVYVCKNPTCFSRWSISSLESRKTSQIFISLKSNTLATKTVVASVPQDRIKKTERKNNYGKDQRKGYESIREWT